MVQSETYYMITINQDPNCEVPLQSVEDGLTKYAMKVSKRLLLARELGSVNGKAHFHLSVELLKETRKDNIARAIISYTKVLKTKNSIDIRGTRGVPYKETWECHAVDYVAKDHQYTTNMDREWIQEKIKEKKLKTEVDQKSIYVDKPKFWKLYREELMKNKEEFVKNYRENPRNPSWEKDEFIHYKWTKQDPDIIRHEIFQKLLKIYTPLWLKHDIIPIIVEYQEGLHMYHEHLEGAVNRNIMFRNDKPLEIEIVGRRV